MKVVALNRIHRRDSENRRVVVPAGAVFEIEAESAEYNDLRQAGAIKNAKASDIELAKENPKLRVRPRMKRARSMKELKAIKAAREFSAENPDLVDPPGKPFEQEVETETQEVVETAKTPVKIETPKVPVKTPVSTGKGGGKQRNLV